MTLDHEQVPQEHLRALVAEGVTVHPGPDALVHAQDKLVMRRRLAALGIPGPRFAEITAPDDLVAFGALRRCSRPCAVATTVAVCGCDPTPGAGRRSCWPRAPR